MFFANLVFTHSFRDTASADMAFASNLLGAMVGGALEYLALLTGFRSLLLLVAGLYVLAFLFSQRWRLLADKDRHPDYQERTYRRFTDAAARARWRERRGG